MAGTDNFYIIRLSRQSESDTRINRNQTCPSSTSKSNFLALFMERGREKESQRVKEREGKERKGSQ